MNPARSPRVGGSIPPLATISLNHLFNVRNRACACMCTCQRRYRTPRTAAAVIVMKYGRAIHTIRKYESRINGAIAEVSKKRNAA